MTGDHGEKDVLAAIRTVPGMHAREHMNQRELESIVKEVIPGITIPLDDVGIISPYNAQVRALADAIPQADVSTVHKFQGREKDMIILSTTDSEITDFSDDANLVNVAVSRAVNRFVLVTNGNPMPAGSCIGDLLDYIEYNSFTVTESKLRSVFDCLYDAFRGEREKYLKNSKRISEFDSENLMYKLITDILSEDEFNTLGVVCHHPLRTLIKDTSLMDSDERRYATHPNTHLDFLIYSKISKKPLLAIEVDGYNYHKDDSRQGERDAMKNSILDKYGLPLLRLKTNGSGEMEQIVSKLNEILS